MQVQYKTDNCLNYSAAYNTLVSCLAQSAELQHRPFLNTTNSIPSFMLNYTEQYQVSPWPVIVDKTFLDKMEIICREIPILLYKVLRFYAQKDPVYLARFLGVNLIEVELFAGKRTITENISLRYDAVVANNELRIIEVNSGASLGGWQHSWIYAEVIAALGEFPELRNVNVRYRNIVAELLLSFCQAARRLKGAQTVGNILLFVPASVGADRYENLCKEFSGLLEQIRPADMPAARLYFFNAAEQVSFDRNGRLIFAGIEMDAVIMNTDSTDNLAKSFFSLLESAAQKEQFYYPDALGYALIGNKLLFALLHEPEIATILVPHQWDLIQKCIPWSARLCSDTLLYKGRKYQTREFVAQHKNKLLFKKAYSMQGKDVVIGCSAATAEWEALYEELKSDPGWLLQEYQLPDPVPLAAPQSGFNLYRMIWGVFALQGKYAGCFLRGSVAETGDTVINSARGATEFLLFEEQPLKNVIRF